MKMTKKKEIPAVVPEIKLQMAEKAVGMLKKIGASYKVLLGEHAWGELEVVTRKRAPRTIANRGARDYVRPFLALLREASDVVTVPATLEFSAVAIQAAISAYGAELWGGGIITTHVKLDKTGVEVMLMEPLPVPGKRLKDDGEYYVEGPLAAAAIGAAVH